jgi:hypothetical protein
LIDLSAKSPTPPAAPAPSAPCATPQPAYWASAVDSDDDDEEELAPMTPPGATKIFCATSEVDKVEVMLLAASNGLSSDGPLATTPGHHLQGVQAICLASDA